MTTKELIEARNKLEAEIISLERKLVDENYKTFVEEVLNLLNGVGQGFVGGDYYAPCRYYSAICGIKNIRFDAEGIKVKVDSPSGYLVPKQIEVRGETYPVHFVRASNYAAGLDY